MQQTHRRLNQRGMVSFMVTMIMMLVISLIVIGFAKVTQRNSREALDRQLSTQAFYAAESGINHTQATIVAALSSTPNLAAKSTCAGGDYSATSGSTGAISPLGSGVKYTCVLVNPTPPDIILNASQTTPLTTPLNVTNPGGADSFTFTWSMEKGGTLPDCRIAGSYQTATTFPTASAWPCSFGVMHVDLIQDPAGALGKTGSQSDNLAASTISVFLTPLGNHFGTVSVAYPSGGTSPTTYVVSGACKPTCTNPTSYSATVNVPSGISSYFARVSSRYHDGAIDITSQTAGVSNNFTGGEAVLDVTGQAQDVLRRIQVRMPLTGSSGLNQIPLDALTSSTSICKRFTIVPPAGSASSDTSNPLCST